MPWPSGSAASLRSRPQRRATTRSWCATNRDADPILRALNMARIPWRFCGTAGLYHQPEVRLLVSFLRAVNDPDDSVSCYDLATSEIFGLDPQDVTVALNAASPAPHAPGAVAAPRRATMPSPRRFGPRAMRGRRSACSPASTSTGA